MGVFDSLLLGWWNTFAVFDFVEAACCCRWGLDPDPSTKLKTYLSFFECFNCCQVGKHVCCCKSFARILNAFTCFAKQNVRVSRANPPAEVQQLNLVAIAAEAEAFVMQHSFLHFHKLYQQHHFKGTSSCWRIPTGKKPFALLVPRWDEMLSTNRIEWCCARGRLLYRGGVLAFWCHLSCICGNLLNGATVSGKFKKVVGWQNRSNLTLQIYSSPRHVVSRSDILLAIEWFVKFHLAGSL